MTARTIPLRPAPLDPANRPVRVVIVDDSALARQLIRAMLGGDGSIEVVGSATDPTTAADIIRTKNPDVITLDVEMPNMDGLTFLEKIMRVKPTPVVMVSSLTERGADVTLQALELGAVDFVTKPRIDVARGFEEKRDELIAKIKAAARARVRALAVVAPAVRERPKMPLVYRTTERIVAIGASTGGVEALRELICALPSDSPATLVVQHMPGGFTQRFAQRLNVLAQVAVVEAQDGQRALPGHVYIAPGERHLRLSSLRGPIRVQDRRRRSRVRPPALGRRPVSLGRRGGRPQRDRRHPHGHGRRRRQGPESHARGRGAHDRPERGLLRRLRHAQGRERARRHRGRSTHRPDRWNDPGAVRWLIWRRANESTRQKIPRRFVTTTQGFDGVLNQNLDDGDEDSGETVAPAHAARQRSKEYSMQSAVTNLNVLVVDDQQMMRDFITARLRELGISQVALAASATEALKQLHEEKFDLIISDWIMPDMTGLDLVKAVRGHPVLKKMPIIMASTWPGRDQMEQAKAEGVDHYLVKPFQTVQLRDSLHDIFGTVQ